MSVPQQNPSLTAATGLARIGQIAMRARELVARGVHFRREPHLVARLPDREVWMAFFDDTEGNTLALLAELRP